MNKYYQIFLKIKYPFEADYTKDLFVVESEEVAKDYCSKHKNVYYKECIIESKAKKFKEITIGELDQDCSKRRNCDGCRLIQFTKMTPRDCPLPYLHSKMEEEYDC